MCHVDLAVMFISQAGRWVHVAVSFCQGEVSMWLDGRRVGLRLQRQHARTARDPGDLEGPFVEVLPKTKLDSGHGLAMAWICQEPLSNGKHQKAFKVRPASIIASVFACP